MELLNWFKFPSQKRNNGRIQENEPLNDKSSEKKYIEDGYINITELLNDKSNEEYYRDKYGHRYNIQYLKDIRDELTNYINELLKDLKDESNEEYDRDKYCDIRNNIQYLNVIRDELINEGRNNKVFLFSVKKYIDIVKTAEDTVESIKDKLRKELELESNKNKLRDELLNNTSGGRKKRRTAKKRRTIKKKSRKSKVNKKCK